MTTAWSMTSLWWRSTSVICRGSVISFPPIFNQSLCPGRNCVRNRRKSRREKDERKTEKIRDQREKEIPGWSAKKHWSQGGIFHDFQLFSQFAQVGAGWRERGIRTTPPRNPPENNLKQGVQNPIQVSQSEREKITSWQICAGKIVARDENWSRDLMNWSGTSCYVQVLKSRELYQSQVVLEEEMLVQEIVGGPSLSR